MFPFAGLLGSEDSSESVTLIGTLGSPSSSSHTAIAPTDALSALAVVCTTSALNSLVRGRVMRAGYDSGETASFVTVHSWVLPNDFAGTYYVRATLVDGVNPNLSGSMGTWQALVNGGANISWIWRHTASSGSTTGTVKLEIATDSGGANIVATGYYKRTATVEP